MKLPELLIPAGSLEKLKTAVLYGADALYLGGQKFGLRAAADNFTLEELAEGVEFAHARGTDIYVVLNSFLHDTDLKELPEFVKYLESLGVDALIVSDLGVIETISSVSDLPIHLSTQASCLNRYSGKLWKKMGVKRLILGRELTINEAKRIKDEVDIEVELFIHGSMCMAYSGHCTISNYTQGRDSNRGGCAHSCRFEYSLEQENSLEAKKAYFMSSKDLAGIQMLEEFINAGIDSVKVEGRMKSPLYAGTIAKVYREALDYYKEHQNFYSDDMKRWESELSKVTHRAYHLGSLDQKAGDDSIYNEREHNDSQYEVVGRIVDILESKAVVEVRNAFWPKTKLEYIPFVGDAVEFQAGNIENFSSQLIEKTRPSTLVQIPLVKGMKKDYLIRANYEA